MQKFILTFKKVFSVLFCLFLLILLSCSNNIDIKSQVFAAKEGASESTVTSDPFNARLAIQVASDGRFNIGAFPNTSGGATSGESWDLLYRWPNAPGTSFTTFRIDGNDFTYGSGSLIQPPTDTDTKTNQSTWKNGDIEVTQTLQLVLNNQTGHEDMAKISYTVKNTGTVPHDVGARIMLDTELNYNDGAPFRIPEQGIITTEKEYTGSAIPDTFTTFFDVTDNIHVAASVLKSGEATAPDRLILASWPKIHATSYDYTIDSALSFTSDSAYALYWNSVTFAAGETRTYTTYFGLAELQVDLRPPLALGVSAPVTLSKVNNTYSPNPFTIVATILNNGTGPASNVSLTIHLPAGLSLSEGSETQSVDDIDVNQERQVSWKVQAAPQTSETVLLYSIDATATNTETKTITKQITLPALEQTTPPPADGSLACSVPAGYTYDFAGYTSRCPSGLTYRLRIPVDNLLSCQRPLSPISLVPVPAGYTFDRAFIASHFGFQCDPNNSQHYLYRWRVPVDGLGACMVPDGFTYDSSKRTSFCDPKNHAHAFYRLRGIPAAPTKVRAKAQNKSVKVTWMAPQLSPPGSIQNYTVTASPGGVQTVVSGSKRNATITGLANGTSYTFMVTATNIYGTSLPSTPSEAVTP